MVIRDKKFKFGHKINRMIVNNLNKLSAKDYHFTQFCKKLLQKIRTMLQIESFCFIIHLLTIFKEAFQICSGSRRFKI